MPEDLNTDVQTSMHRILTGNEFFGGLDEGVVRQIAALAKVRRAQAGQLIFQKGDPGDALFAVKRGQVRILAGTAAGRSLTLNMLGPGDVFGEIALLDGQHRTADAVASEATELLFIPRSDFSRLLKSEPEVAAGVIGLLCARIRWMSERMEETNMASLPARLAARLVALCDDYGDEILITQEELARFVRSSREQVNRQLQIWRRAGILEIGRSRIRVLEPGALGDFRC